MLYMVETTLKLVEAPTDHEIGIYNSWMGLFAYA